MDCRSFFHDLADWIQTPSENPLHMNCVTLYASSNSRPSNFIGFVQASFTKADMDALGVTLTAREGASESYRTDDPPFSQTRSGLQTSIVATREPEGRLTQHIEINNYVFEIQTLQDELVIAREKQGSLLVASFEKTTCPNPSRVHS